MPADDAAHAPHAKALQLGVELDPLADDDPRPLTDPADQDAAWADATTVDEFAADLATLAATCTPDELTLLAEARRPSAPSARP